MNFQRKYADSIDLELSAITPKNQVILSQISEEIEPKTGKVIHTSRTVDVKDVVELIAMLRNQAPIFYATGQLMGLYQEIQDALHDLLAGLKEAKK